MRIHLLVKSHIVLIRTMCLMSKDLVSERSINQMLDEPTDNSTKVDASSAHNE